MQGMFIAAFNHITPFPGTPLYDRLKDEGRLLYDAWWLDDRYRYNMVPFQPALMSPERLEEGTHWAWETFDSEKPFLIRTIETFGAESPRIAGRD